MLSFEDLRELDYLQFGLLSAEDIVRQSVCEVSHLKLTGPNSVYDERMGTLDPNKKCLTCTLNSKMCVGHFGHINLHMYVLHPLFHKLSLSILKCICYKCSRLLLTREQLELNGHLRFHKQARFHKIIERMDRVDYCAYCETIQPRYVFSHQDKYIYMIFKIEGENSRIQMSENEIFKIFENVLRDDIILLGFDPTHFHPKNLVLTVLPVLPPVARPYVVADNITCDDDLTIQYLEIVKANHHIGDLATSDLKRQKHIYALKFKIKSLFDNSGDRQRVSNGRPLKGIKKRLTGKEGLIRNNLMGKRVDKSARTVIGPDPTLNVDEIAVPQEIADILSYTIVVNDNNKEAVYDMIEKGHGNFLLRNDGNVRINLKYACTKQGTRLQFGDIICRSDGRWTMISTEKELFSLREGDHVFRHGEKLQRLEYNTHRKIELHVGDVIERKLYDGDILFLNRQPTLHRGSMIAQKIRIRPGKTIRMNLAITSSFNADFDGDEMNLHCPASTETEAELRELSSVRQNLMNNQSSKANIVIVQDALLGNFLMTRKKQQPLSREHFFQIASILSERHLTHLDSKVTRYRQLGGFSASHYDGRMLFSLLLPTDFFYRQCNQADPEEPDVVIKEGILVAGAITKANLGSGHRSLITLLYHEYGEETCIDFINHVQFLSHKYLLWTGFTVGLSDCIVTKKDEIQKKISMSFVKAKSIEEHTKDKRLREVYVLYALSGARDTGMAIAKNALQDTNNFLSTVVSGAKGDYFNIAQITGILGQQNLNGQRVQPLLNNNTRTLPHYPILPEHYTDDMRYESAGFIRSSFVHGLSPREFFFHAMTGREGITDTAMKSVTGDTMVILLIDNRPVYAQIGIWIDRLLNMYASHVLRQEERDMEMLSVADIFIPSTDDDGNVSWAPVVAVTRHDPGEYLYTIRTQSGRRVTVSESKSLIIWDSRLGALVEKDMTAVQIGDRVPVTLSLPAACSTCSSFEQYEENMHPGLCVLDVSGCCRVLANFEKKNKVGDHCFAYDNQLTRDGLVLLYSRLGMMTDISQEPVVRVCTEQEYDIHRDVFLDPIVEISRVPVVPGSRQKVYDLTVPTTLNFGIANGLHVRDTATSGYIQRRMVKIAEDIQVKYDGTVRNSVNNIIQYAYGENFLNPDNTIFLSQKPTSCDVGRLVESLNFELSEQRK